jgi:DNA-binding NarL/FixJ family response regulator
VSAITLVRTVKPDVVLLDIRLPDIDGFEVTRRLAREGGEATVVLVSSRDAADYGGRLANSGAQGFIAKADLSATALEAVLAGESWSAPS